MEFTIETTYDQKAMTAMVRAIRRVVRKKQNKRSHIFGTAVMILGLLLLFTEESFSLRQVVTASIVALIAVVQVFQDPINAYIARKRGLPGMDTAVATFHKDGYHSRTFYGESEFRYDTVQRFIDADAYFVFAFSPSHGQVYDKRTLTGGTEEEFVAFISEKTGKQLETA